MKIFSKLFEKTAPKQWTGPDIQFGRFNDAEKSPEKYKQWDEAMISFDTEKYLNSYIHFLEFLKDEHQQNVSYFTKQGVLNFAIIQGSKVIKGIADHQTFSAEARLVKAPNPPLPMMRYLLEANYELKYNKYAINDENHVTLVFDTLVEDSSPYKLYQALKELATEADRKDDFLMNKYSGLETIDIEYLRPVSDQEKLVKYNFFKLKIEKALDIIDHGSISQQEYPGAITYVILDALYTIDFLVKPEGRAKEIITTVHERYFNDTASTIYDKNRWMITKLRELVVFSYEELSAELYEVKSTFGIAKAEGPEMLSSIINAQEADLMWYYDEHPEPFVPAICGYVVGYALYNYALPGHIRELLMIYYRMVYTDFFKDLGFEPQLILSEKESKGYRQKILDLVQQIYPEDKDKILVAVSSLNFSDKVVFCKSFLSMLKSIIPSKA